MPRPTSAAIVEPGTARLGVLASLACVLQVAESLLPHPVPGIRLGLANMVTLIALVELGPRSAIGLVFLRTIAGSMILGTFLTPSFLLSFSGGMASTLAMAALYLVATRSRFLRFSFIGISVAGSIAHVFTQLVLVYLLFVTSRGVWLLSPWLALSSVAMGVVTGLIAGQVFAVLRSPGRTALSSGQQAPAPAAVAGQYAPGGTLLHRLPSTVKLVAVLAVAVAVIAVPSLRFYGAVVLLLVLLTALARVRLAILFRGLRRLLALVLFSLLMPVLFSPWGRVLFTAGPLRVTLDGLLAGVLFAARIVILFWATSLLAATTMPDDMAGGLARLLTPLRLVGIQSVKVAQAITITWAYFPVLWQNARSLLRARDRSGRLRDKLVSVPGTLVANLYVLADQLSAGAVRAASEPANPGPPGS